MKVGQKIGLYLKEQGIRQNEVARKIGARPSTVSSWLRGKCEPSISDYAKICEALCVPLDTFLGDMPRRGAVEVVSGGELYVKIRTDIMLRRDFFEATVDAAQEMGYRQVEHLIGQVLHIDLHRYYAEQLQGLLDGYRAYHGHRFRQEVRKNGNRL